MKVYIQQQGSWSTERGKIDTALTSDIGKSFEWWWLLKNSLEKKYVFPKIPSCPHSSCPGRWSPSPCSVQCSFPSCLFASGRKMLQSVHAQLWSRWSLHQLTENTNRRCRFQANGQKISSPAAQLYGYWSQRKMSVRTSGSCLRRWRIADKFVQSTKRLIRRHWAAGILLINCSHQAAGLPSLRAMVRWASAGSRRQDKGKWWNSKLNK